MSTTQRDAIRYFCQQKGMTEEQLADEINKAFEQPTGEELLHVLNKGHEQGYKDAIDKACEWLNANYAEIYLLARGGFSSDKVVEQFKKYMEESKWTD